MKKNNLKQLKEIVSNEIFFRSLISGCAGFTKPFCFWYRLFSESL